MEVEEGRPFALLTDIRNISGSSALTVPVTYCGVLGPNDNAPAHRPPEHWIEKPHGISLEPKVEGKMAVALPWNATVAVSGWAGSWADALCTPVAPASMTS